MNEKKETQKEKLPSMAAMNKYANNYRNFLDVSSKLNVACYSVNARNAKYQSIPA